MMNELLAQLHHEIKALAAGKCLLWVDPAQRDAYEDNDIVTQRRVRVPINHVRFAMHRAPYLVPLDLAMPADVKLFNDSVERAWQAWTIDSLRAMRGQAICGWVITDAHAEALAVHWGRHCHLHGHQYKTKLLRFHDPGIREWLWPTLSDKQRHALWGPATCVFAVGRDRNLLCHAGGTNDAVPDSFHLDDLQWQHLGDYATVHAAWLACAIAADTSLLPSLSEPQLLATLPALDQATRHGVTQRTERQLYARHALQLGPRFYADVRMQAVWEQTRTGDYYGSVIEDIFACAADELHLHWKSTEERTAWAT
jgi:hypothetical protein